MPLKPVVMFILIVLFLIVSCLFLYNYNNLLQTIILLELLTFSVLSIFSYLVVSSPSSDQLVIVLFSLFVIEGVIALSGLILLVSFTGSDYISTSSLVNC